MTTGENRKNIVDELQAGILRLQGYKTAVSTKVDAGLGPIKEAFHGGAFPTGAIHEFLPNDEDDNVSMDGFVAGILSSLMGKNGAAIWVSASRMIFPPALASFGLEPDRIIFVDVPKEKDVIWVMEEALKCGALTAVVGEAAGIDFILSRRLQLAVEQSGVTGFVLRNHSSKLNPTACVSRWRVSSASSESVEDLPGVGYPQWHVELLRVRNGKPGKWEVKWSDGRLVPVYSFSSPLQEKQKKTGS